MARPRKNPLTPAQTEALDHDQDGKAGGSVPVKDTERAPGDSPDNTPPSEPTRHWVA